jgi:hypothetical protein
MMMSAELEVSYIIRIDMRSTEGKARQVQRAHGVHRPSHLVSFPGLWTFLHLSIQSLVCE